MDRRATLPRAPHERDAARACGPACARGTDPAAGEPSRGREPGAVRSHRRRAPGALSPPRSPAMRYDPQTDPLPTRPDGCGPAGRGVRGREPCRQPRYVAIDVVKGIAIVWVLFIHSAALGMETPVFVYLVNHAVPVFLVLFGLNSELWWRRRAFPEALGAWFRGRARRILVPMWAMIPVWWALVLWFRPPDVTLSARLLVLHALGWMRSIGTGWFITLVIQLVVAFPLLHVAAARVGRAPLLAAGLASTLVLTGLALRLMGPLGYFGYIVLAPRFFVHVVFGMMLAPVVGRLGVRTAVASAVLVVVLVALQRGVPIGGLAAYAERLEDLPLTTLLLVAALPLARVPLLGGALEWLGQ